ncbi:MAG: hypothetical protein J6T39_01295, partial [Clostridia bacterium]|nr:hypothetical protein [Clostridia bacterium]
EITLVYYYSNFIGYDNWEDMGNCLGYWAYAVKKTNIYLSQANLTRAQNMTVWVDEALGGGIGWGTNPSLVVDYIGEFDHAEEDEFFEAVCVRIIYFHEFIDGYSVDPSTICDGDVRWYTDGGDYGIEFKLLPTNEVLYENFYESDSHHNLESAGVVAEVIVPTAIIVLGIAAFVVVSKKKEQF